MNCSTDSNNPTSCHHRASRKSRGASALVCAKWRTGPRALLGEGHCWNLARRKKTGGLHRQGKRRYSALSVYIYVSEVEFWDFLEHHQSVLWCSEAEVCSLVESGCLRQGGTHPNFCVAEEAK